MPAAAIACPVCATLDPTPIVYGLPGGDLFERAERGEVVLGGCGVTGDDPEWRCRNPACGAEFPLGQRPRGGPSGRRP